MGPFSRGFKSDSNKIYEWRRMFTRSKLADANAPPPLFSFMLLESGEYLLLEDNDNMIVE